MLRLCVPTQVSSSSRPIPAWVSLRALNRYQMHPMRTIYCHLRGPEQAVWAAVRCAWRCALLARRRRKASGRGGSGSSPSRLMATATQARCHCECDDVARSLGCNNTGPQLAICTSKPRCWVGVTGASQFAKAGGADGCLMLASAGWTSTARWWHPRRQRAAGARVAPRGSAQRPRRPCSPRRELHPRSRHSVSSSSRSSRTSRRSSGRWSSSPYSTSSLCTLFREGPMRTRPLRPSSGRATRRHWLRQWPSLCCPATAHLLPQRTTPLAAALAPQRL